MICDHSHNHTQKSAPSSGAVYCTSRLVQPTVRSFTEDSPKPAIPSARKPVAEVNDSFTSIRALGTAYI